MSTQPHTTEPELQKAREQEVTDEVVASFAGAVSPRYREVMQSLVRHLHAFAREVRLTQGEWEAGIEFLDGDAPGVRLPSRWPAASR